MMVSMDVLAGILGRYGYVCTEIEDVSGGWCEDQEDCHGPFEEVGS